MREVAIEAIAILALIVLNGFFAMSEMAIVSAKRGKLRKLMDAGDGKAAAALRLASAPDHFFPAVQIGITLVGVLTGTFSGATIARAAEAFLAAIPGLRPYAGALSLMVVVVAVSYLTLVVGELAPKRIALGRPEGTARLAAPVMGALIRLTMPAVKLLSLSTNGLIRLLGLKLSHQTPVTEEEIRAMVQEGARSGVLESVEKDMIERVIRLGDRQVGALMTHRSRIVFLDLEDSMETSEEKMERSPYSRFPVIRGDVSDLVGVLKAKDYLAARRKGGEVNLLDHVAPPYYVPETMKALRILEAFKTQERMHFAVVVDEYGDVQGVVTLNDILEAIVGDISSVGETAKPRAYRREDGSWIIDATMPMDEVCAVLGVDEEEPDGPGLTLAGFLLKRMGEIPAPGMYVDARGLRFEVVDMDDQRIDAVLVTKLASGPGPA